MQKHIAYDIHPSYGRDKDPPPFFPRLPVNLHSQAQAGVEGVSELLGNRPVCPEYIVGSDSSTQFTLFAPEYWPKVGSDTSSA